MFSGLVFTFFGRPGVILSVETIPCCWGKTFLNTLGNVLWLEVFRSGRWTRHYSRSHVACRRSDSNLLKRLFVWLRVASQPTFKGVPSLISGVSASASVLAMNIQDWFPLGWTGLISLHSKGLSRVFSNTTVQKDQFFSFLYSPTLTSIHDYWKNHSFD